MSASTKGASQKRGTLARANEVRAERIRLLGGLGSRAADKVPSGRAVELILDPPGALLGMRIDHFLGRVQGLRPARVLVLLDDEGITGTRLIWELSPRQRQRLAEQLGRDSDG